MVLRDLGVRIRSAARHQRRLGRDDGPSGLTDHTAFVRRAVDVAVGPPPHRIVEAGGTDERKRVDDAGRGGRLDAASQVVGQRQHRSDQGGFVQPAATTDRPGDREPRQHGGEERHGGHHGGGPRTEDQRGEKGHRAERVRRTTRRAPAPPRRPHHQFTTTAE